MPIRRLIPPVFVFLWATGFIGARYAMPWAEPFAFLSVRFALACTILLGLAVLTGWRSMPRAQALHAGFAGVLMHGVYLGGVFWAIHRGLPAGIAALIVGLQPLMTALLAGRFLGETILPRHWLGLALGFAGVVTVLAPRLGTLGSGITAATLTAALVAVLGMTVGTIWQKRFVGQTDLLAGTACQYAGGAAVMALAALMLESGTYTLNRELVFATLWLVLVLSIGAVVLLMVMIREGEMAKVASLFYLVPAVTAVIAWLLFDERLTLVQIAGMALTTFGVALATRQPGTRALASK